MRAGSREQGAAILWVSEPCVTHPSTPNTPPPTHTRMSNVKKSELALYNKPRVFIRLQRVFSTLPKVCNPINIYVKKFRFHLYQNVRWKSGDFIFIKTVNTCRFKFQDSEYFCRYVHMNFLPVNFGFNKGKLLWMKKFNFNKWNCLSLIPAKV